MLQSYGSLMMLKFLEIRKKMKKLFLVFILVIFQAAFAQVAVNETNPSSAAALYLEAQKVPTTNFGGFLMPVVTETQQASIPVSTIDNRDDGLMVFVSDAGTGKHCWEIYDSYAQLWRSITCTTEPPCNSVLYSEDFSSYSANTGITGASATNGDYPAGVTKWTLSSYTTIRDGNTAYPGTLVDATDYALVIGGQLEIRDTNGPLLFQTQSIDISGYTNITFSCDFSETGTLEYYTAQHTDDYNCGMESQGSDYIDVLYSTDGGTSFTEVPNFSGFGNANHTLNDDLLGTVNFSVSGLSGSSLVIRIRLQNWSDDERYFIDNLQVTCN